MQPPYLNNSSITWTVTVDSLLTWLRRGINIRVKSIKAPLIDFKSSFYFPDSCELSTIIIKVQCLWFYILAIRSKAVKVTEYDFKIQTFNGLMIVEWITMGKFGVTFGSSTGSVLSPNKLFMTPAYIVFLTKSCKSPSPKIKIW